MGDQHGDLTRSGALGSYGGCIRNDKERQSLFSEPVSTGLASTVIAHRASRAIGAVRAHRVRTRCKSKTRLPDQ